MVISKEEPKVEPTIGESIVRNILKKEGKPVLAKRRLLDDDSRPSLKQSEYTVKGKSHEEHEIEIQSGRILYVLDETVQKLQIAACLPTLIENEGEQLRELLTDEEVEFIVDACGKYAERDIIEYDDMRSLDSSVIQAKFQQLPLYLKESKIDIHVSQSIDIIYNCKELMENIALIAQFNQDDISEKFIDGVRQLRAAAAQKLAVSALEERQREKELRIAWKENAEAQILIKSIQERLDKQTEELEAELNVKNDLIEMYNEKIEALKRKFKDDIQKRVTESEKSMVKHSQLSEERQVALALEAKEANHEYQALVEAHMASEKLLRAKRFKVEAQLASWLAKYDADIGERQSELEELTKQYEEEMEQLNELQQKFDEQEEEYVELMAERDEYEQMIWDAKAFVFLQTRSARRIQRCWREYKERKLARKRARKARREKKKKSAEEGGADSAGTAGTESGKGKKGKGKGKGKGKARKEKRGDFESSRGADPNLALQSAFKGDILEDINIAPIPPAEKVDLTS